MRAALVFAILLLAGCATPSASVPAATPPAAPSVSAAVTLPIHCMFFCYEPSIVADPAGRILVSDGITADLALSQDGGRTWTNESSPPIPGPLTGFQTDVVLQLSPAGRLYYSALIARNVPGKSGLAIEGIQVAASDDGGASWKTDTYLAPISDPTTVVYSPDRQWLAFGAGDTMYITYNQLPTGIWIAHSSDAGKTWTGWTRAVTGESRGGAGGQSGPAIVTAKGDVIVPACMDGDATNSVLISTDGAKTFTRHDVGPGCSWFPIVALAPDGSIVAAWQDLQDTQVATSADGTTWTKPIEWGNKTDVAPWPIPGRNGTLALAWYATHGSTDDLLVASGTLAGGPGQKLTIVTGLDGKSRSPASTDYANAARLADGRIGVVWAKGKATMFAASLT